MSEPLFTVSPRRREPPIRRTTRGFPTAPPPVVPSPQGARFARVLLREFLFERPGRASRMPARASNLIGRSGSATVAPPPCGGAVLEAVDLSESPILFIADWESERAYAPPLRAPTRCPRRSIVFPCAGSPPRVQSLHGRQHNHQGRQHAFAARPAGTTLPGDGGRSGDAVVAGPASRGRRSRKPHVTTRRWATSSPDAPSCTARARWSC
jgi:hypothetical protein